VSTEQICLSEQIPAVGEGESDVRKLSDLPSWFDVKDGKPVVMFNAGNGGDEDNQGDEGNQVRSMTVSEPYTILFRAEMDNDSINFIRKPMRKWYKESSTHLASKRDNGRIATEWAIKDAKKMFLCSDLYEGCRLSDGKEGVLVTSLLHPVHCKGKIPRFGKAFKLDQAFSSVTYRGRVGESYMDMKEQFPIGDRHCSVKEMTEPNIRPQESGNRCDTRFAVLSNGKWKVGFYAVDKSFELSVKPYSDRELIGMKHREDEKTSGTYVTINAFQQGIGTGSCGPYTLDEHCYDASKDYIVRFIITREHIDG
ncbi:MAG: hypothetical protein J5800_02475, partial [Spirochaetales bacterium]|nr:hypothetical protein [Spirochaetales bacterium]